MRFEVYSYMIFENWCPYCAKFIMNMMKQKERDNPKVGR